MLCRFLRFSVNYKQAYIKTFATTQKSVHTVHTVKSDSLLKKESFDLESVQIASKFNNYISINTVVHLYVIMIKVSLNCIFPFKILKPPSPDLTLGDVNMTHCSLLCAKIKSKGTYMKLLRVILQRKKAQAFSIS